MSYTLYTAPPYSFPSSPGLGDPGNLSSPSVAATLVQDFTLVTALSYIGFVYSIENVVVKVEGQFPWLIGESEGY